MTLQGVALALDYPVLRALPMAFAVVEMEASVAELVFEFGKGPLDVAVVDAGKGLVHMQHVEAASLIGLLFGA